VRVGQADAAAGLAADDELDDPEVPDELEVPEEPDEDELPDPDDVLAAGAAAGVLRVLLLPFDAARASVR
jgi:hypothetical protein